MPFTIAEIAQRLGGEIIGDASLIITGFAHPSSAKTGELTFAESEKYFVAACQSNAAAILVSGDVPSTTKTLIKVPNARVAFARVLPLFHTEPTYAAGIHPSAVIAPLAQIDPTAHIGPHCVVEDGVKIGPRSALIGGNHIGANTQIGADCRFFPNVTVYANTLIGDRVRIHASSVIGADGFGYVFDAGVHLKVPQIGNVILGDDVEIGSCSTVDRGALGSTIIGAGTKIDNLVQVGHNVQLGKHCIVCAEVGISGSTKIGDYTTLAGKVGLAGHLKIGNRVTVMAQAGVMNDIPDGERWLGSPAVKDRQFKRQIIAIQQLPELLKRVRQLELKLGISETESLPE